MQCTKSSEETKEILSHHTFVSGSPLDWLPVEYRSQYKILLLVYKSLHGKGPAYLASMLKEYNPIRSLRSSNKFRLQEPPVNKKYGDRAFSVTGPRLWNQ